MQKECHVLIVGAGTTGIYFGWLMAKRGHSIEEWVQKANKLWAKRKNATREFISTIAIYP